MKKASCSQSGIPIHPNCHLSDSGIEYCMLISVYRSFRLVDVYWGSSIDSFM